MIWGYHYFWKHPVEGKKNTLPETNSSHLKNVWLEDEITFLDGLCSNAFVFFQGGSTFFGWYWYHLAGHPDTFHLLGFHLCVFFPIQILPNPWVKPHGFTTEPRLKKDLGSREVGRSLGVYEWIAGRRYEWNELLYLLFLSNRRLSNPSCGCGTPSKWPCFVILTTY